MVFLILYKCYIWGGGGAWPFREGFAQRRLHFLPPFIYFSHMWSCNLADACITMKGCVATFMIPIRRVDLWPQSQIYRVLDMFSCPDHKRYYMAEYCRYNVKYYPINQSTRHITFLLWHWLTIFGTVSIFNEAQA